METGFHAASQDGVGCLPRCADGVWDVDVHWGEDIEDSGAPPSGQPIASFVHDNVAWYTAAASDSGYLLAETVTASLLALRGETVLHASAVAIDGAAVAFVGQSGRGKSTIAALLCVAGAELVTDDVLTVDPGPPVMCAGGASELRLRQAAAKIGQGRPGTSSRRTADDRLALAVKAAPQRPLPVAAIVIPSPSRTAVERGVQAA